MAKEVEVRGLKELEQQFVKYPLEYNKVMIKTTVGSMLVLQQNVPPYPPKPAGSKYRRTGTLGRSLGVSMGGGRAGKPSVFKVRQIGGTRMNIIGRMGTNLRYAGDVIGDRSQQKHPFSAYWWRLEQVIGPSFNKINRLFNIATDELAKFLERQ